MRKNRLKGFLSAVLALALLLAPLCAADAAGGVRTLESGAEGAEKMEPWEIALLFGGEKTLSPENAYAREPDLTAPFEDAGETSGEHLEAALERLNHLRTIAGLPAVTLNRAYIKAAQDAAYVDALSGGLTHTPGKADGLDDRIYAAGYSGAGKSNLAWFGGRSDLVQSVDLWASDTDSSNISCLGHRRWALNPAMSATGFGYCYGAEFGTYTAMYAFDLGGGAGDYDFIGWPASGYFPAGEGFFESDSAWSVTLNPDEYARPALADVTVTLTRESDGKTWTFSGGGYAPGDGNDYFNVDTEGYGVGNCIIFRPAGIGAYEGRYTVAVTGVKTKSGAAADFSYTVEFFPLRDTIAAYTVPDFKDVTQDWMREPVSFVYSHGHVMGGTAPDRFSPTANVDLGTALTVMARLSGVDTAVSSAENWMRPGMEWGRKKGLTESTDGTDGIERQELVWMLWRVAGQPEADETALRTWPDYGDVEPEYREALTWAVSAGILTGDGNRLRPAANTQRAQLAAFVQRAFEGGYLG